MCISVKKKRLTNESALFLCFPQIILEIRKEGDYRIPTWIIIGSTLGGLLLLALLSLALWKVSHHIINPHEENILKYWKWKWIALRPPVHLHWASSGFLLLSKVGDIVLLTASLREQYIKPYFKPNLLVEQDFSVGLGCDLLVENNITSDNRDRKVL